MQLVQGLKHTGLEQEQASRSSRPAAGVGGLGAMTVLILNLGLAVEFDNPGVGLLEHLSVRQAVTG